MLLLKEAHLDGIWDKIRNSDQYASLRNELLEAHALYENEPLKTLKYSDFKIFNLTGSRFEGERPYFKRRGILNTYALLSLIYGEDKYIHPLEDIIWAICDEYTWSVPAHLFGVSQETHPVHIDLFAAETGFALSEILYLLDNKLDATVKTRVKNEIKRRIIDAYENNGPFVWETKENNWAAVCTAGVGAAYMYNCPERFDSVSKRLFSALDYFLKSYKDDGACAEGISYWNYGFGFFIYFAALYDEFKGGNTDILSSSKIGNIAKFHERANMLGNVKISFSDTASSNSHYISGLVHFLHKKFNTAVPHIKYSSGLLEDHCYRWASCIRSVLWFDPNIDEIKIEEKNTHFPDSEIFIARRFDGETPFAFAAKCGHNLEPHNHNDVGGFIFAAGDKQIFCDLGMGEYTHQYFGAERYNFLVNSSRGHSLPIINGQYQKFGEEYKGTVVHADVGVYEFDIAAAYGIKELDNLLRKFEMTDTGVIISGQYRFNTTPESVVERLVSLIPPVIDGDPKDGMVKVDNVTLKYSPEALECHLGSEIYINHSGKEATVYFIDLKVKDLNNKNVSTQYEIIV